MREHLNETERTLGFKYPPSFVAGIKDFSACLSSDGFLRVFGEARLLLSAGEISVDRERIPEELIPFMRIEQTFWPDFYAFDLTSSSPEFKVVVWSDHAIVAEWETFPAFSQWVREHIAKHENAE